MRVVGMDVHVRNSFLCVTDPDGQLLKRGRVGNSLSQIAEFLGALPGGDQPLKVVLESTTNPGPQNEPPSLGNPAAGSTSQKSGICAERSTAGGRVGSVVGFSAAESQKGIKAKVEPFRIHIY